MSFSTVRPWIGTKKIAFVPVFRDSPDVVPPDVIPENWKDVIMDRVVGGPPENWRDVTLRRVRRVVNDRRDRSLRAWLQRVSWGKADIEPKVFEIRTVTQKHVEPDHFALEKETDVPDTEQWLNEDHLKTKYLLSKKSDKCSMCNHTGELHDFDEVGTYCLICETYE